MRGSIRLGLGHDPCYLFLITSQTYPWASASSDTLTQEFGFFLSARFTSTEYPQSLNTVEKNGPLDKVCCLQHELGEEAEILAF